jgi:DNA-binding beta-propeller fold protein YncE
VGDLGTGNIYRYSLITKKTKLLVSGLSAPSALRFDDQTGRLYIADAGRRKIFTVDTLAKRPVATEFASRPLKSPSGIASFVNGGLAVTDLDADTVFVFSNEGKLLFRFP